MKIITNDGTELNKYNLNEKSKFLASSIMTDPTISALCCWSTEKIDYIICYEAARMMDIPFIPLSASIEFNQVTSLINTLPFSTFVYKDKRIIKFKNSKSFDVSDWLAVAKLCFFTSGSSGDKKLVFLSDENISSAVAGIQERLKYSESDCVINFLPMAFDYGFYQYLLVKNSGATLFLIDQGLSIATVSLIDTVNASILPLVPSMVTSIISLSGKKFNGKSIKKITSTGEAISNGLINQIKSILSDAEFYVMYGLTECKRVSILLPDDEPYNKNSVGRAISSSKIFIKNPDALGIGEILVSGKNVALGTLSLNPSKTITRQDFNGKLSTGDLGYLDSNGFLYVLGRIDSQIKILGIRTSTIEIENEALSIPGVITCKVSADKAGCYLQCITEENITVKYIRQSLMMKLGEVATKIVITVSENLEMTSNYKLKRIN
ncbi:AMP-binding protein [Xenorhabdus sp. Flor]|uniref:AMP-binding protein n=1 Tax=Xenorhabdus cabanillasii TaxID=351673 RepID=UPI00199B5168|nr:AMP-binding protein [Xenorhabdus sp. Flor]MBD2815934.1 AMP-binding protein [Xenorhabdus sp. Flor]